MADSGDIRAGGVRRLAARVGWALACVAGLVSLSGCVVGAVAGGMMRSYELTGTSEVEAEYQGLAGKAYAVVIVADRLIQAEHPDIIPRLTTEIDRRLYENAGATQHIPPTRIINYQYNNPEWKAIPRGELAERLGVDRLVVVEMFEYRLIEGGNEYMWDGRASCAVEVYETDSGLVDLPAFERQLAVGYPDGPIFLKDEISAREITSVLSFRLANRVAWLFYDHEESNRISY